MRYHLIALFTIFVWGTTFISTKVLLENFSPLWILLLRFAAGLLVLCFLRPRALKLKERRHELLFLAAGATGIASYYLLENVALVFTTATAVGVIVAAAPLLTALAQTILGDRSALTARFFLGFLVAMAGLLVVSFGNNPQEAAPGPAGGAGALGDALAFFAALIWAAYSLLVKRIADLEYETVASTKRTFLWGLAFIVPAALAFGGAPPQASAFAEPVNAANLMFLGVVASAVCFVTWGSSVKHLGAAAATAYIYLVPAITAMCSAAMIGEALTPVVAAGVALTIGGLFLSQKRGNAAEG